MSARKKKFNGVVVVAISLIAVTTIIRGRSVGISSKTVVATGPNDSSLRVTAVAPRPPDNRTDRVSAPAEVASEQSDAIANRKLEILNQILASRNDNDPRLDTEFRDLDTPLKDKLHRLYLELAPEELNSRGMLVFLLGREIRTSEDAQFMSLVLQDLPCKSLENCKSDRAVKYDVSYDQTADAVDVEHESDVTLAYPQIIATVSLVKNWSMITDTRSREELKHVLTQAAESTNAALARSARTALASIQKLNNRR